MRGKRAVDLPKRGPLAQEDEEARIRGHRMSRLKHGGPRVHEQAASEALVPVDVPRLASGDAGVIDAVERALRAEIAGRRPMSVAIVRIDRWFSRRWLTFAGKNLGALRVTSARLVIPPFVPGRVLGETHLRWDASEAAYVRDPEAAPFHVEQSSGANHARTLAGRGSSCVALWLGVSAKDGRAAAMLYAVGPPAAETWYVSLVRTDGGWHVDFADPMSVPEARESMGLKR